MSSLGPIHERREAPASTYEAALYELSRYGVAQLGKPNCRRRIGDLSSPQIKELAAALRRMQKKYPHLAITDELVAKIEGLL